MLVVDDEPLVRVVASVSLEEAGFDVLEATSADHALDLPRSRADFGILFTDINMPGSLDGTALAKCVHELWPHVRIVVTFGRGLPEPLPDDGKFLRQPYSVTELRETIVNVSARP
ncbi:response regulator [Phenylobacterium sp.]|uniref:response regulator n=1 Tax=Phenylobacterium sp. TaxID=1871053 RepID=UPI0025FEBD59|nr:response regulator [Phenylobacterium sp.]